MPTLLEGYMLILRTVDEYGYLETNTYTYSTIEQCQEERKQFKANGKDGRRYYDSDIVEYKTIKYMYDRFD